MKVIVNFGENKVVVPCGNDGNISIRELIYLATTKYCKLSYYNNTNESNLTSDQVQLRLNNGAVVDPDDRVCDVVDDREELFAIVNSYQINYPSHTTTMNSNGELSSSVTSSNLSSSLSEHERLGVPSPYNRHEVVVTDADLRSRSLRVKNDPNFNSRQQSSFNNKMIHRQIHSPATQNPMKFHSSVDNQGMYNVCIDDKTGDQIFSIILPKENSPLGIHVIPYSGDEQQVDGLVLQNIEADGRIQRQGILQINDRIIEINRTNIEQCSFEKAQLIFRTALLEPELELKIARSLPKSSKIFQSNVKTRSTLSEISQNNDPAFVDNEININSLNTRRLGKIIKIKLVKGSDGLGFKLASRDNPTGAANPIYVKTIFPKGAAIEDGRLQRGDRLLAVGSIDITQMSLQEAVSLLRDTRPGETVELSVSRQCEGTFSQDSSHINETTKQGIKPQISTFDIPLNDTSSAGLGITLKGKTSIVDGQTVDLGIFVKSILTGGAASRDNRLRPNDQLLIINDSSLVNLSNLEAAAILHEAVRHEIQPGHIKLTISRSPIISDEQLRESTRHVKEIDLSSSPLPSLRPMNNDENELDLTTYVPPPVLRKPPSQQSNRHMSRIDSARISDSHIRTSSPRSLSSVTHSTKMKANFTQEQTEQQIIDEIDSNRPSPFERETPFRQSVSEKRRLTNQPNKQVIQWKQRSFHDSRTNNDRKSYPMMSAASIEILTPVIDISDDDDDDDFHLTDNHCRYTVTRRSEQPMRALPDSSTNNEKNNGTSSVVIRSSSFESIQLTNEGHGLSNIVSMNDDDRNNQAKLRGRTCNDSFRQAVDKSYSQEQNIHEMELIPDDKSNKTEKQRFRLSNLFSTRSKRKDGPEEKSSKSIFLQQQTNSFEPNTISYLPPPPMPFNSSNRQIKYSNNDRPSTSFSYSSTINEQQGYQPYYFDSKQSASYGKMSTIHITPSQYESQFPQDYQSKSISGKSSLIISNQRSKHPPIPRQFLQTNVNSSQPLRYNLL